MLLHYSGDTKDGGAYAGNTKLNKNIYTSTVDYTHLLHIFCSSTFSSVLFFSLHSILLKRQSRFQSLLY